MVSSHASIFIVLIGDSIHPTQQLRLEVESGLVAAARPAGQFPYAGEEVARAARAHICTGAHSAHRNTHPHLLNRRYHRSIVIQRGVQYLRQTAAPGHLMVKPIALQLAVDLLVADVEVLRNLRQFTTSLIFQIKPKQEGA